MVFRTLLRLKKIWDDHGFLVLFLLIIIFFLVYWFFETRHEPYGTYSLRYYYDPDIFSNSSSSTKKASSSSVPPSSSKGEQICRAHVQKRLGLPFVKCRPPFLYNEVTGENLELDLYNDKLKLAVEYNGRQHYEYIPFFHQTRDKFQTQKYRDKMKHDLCQKHGIRLIIVPFTVPHDQIGNYIDQELRRLEIHTSSYDDHVSS